MVRHLSQKNSFSHLYKKRDIVLIVLIKSYSLYIAMIKSYREYPGCSAKANWLNKT